ncbi:MAG: NAD regulator [Pseudomonadota bacterium]
MDALSSQAIGIDLTASVVSLVDGAPSILTLPRRGSQSSLPSLPSGPFAPLQHRTLELALRGFVEEQTGYRLGYIEQLYTFADRGRHATVPSSSPHVVSIGYVALTRFGIENDVPLGSDETALAWHRWYEYFPWEDWRSGKPKILDSVILPALADWLASDPADQPPGRIRSRKERVAFAFGGADLNAVAFNNGSASAARLDSWDDERVLERYELLYEAGLIGEAHLDGRARHVSQMDLLGKAMALDHRRILATAIARLRGKMKYRPVVFELMPAAFTLTELQRAVEAISGRLLHKQNFRRLVERGGLVEPTGSSTLATGGRPAALYRFHREVISERPSAGLRFGQPVVR